MARKILFLDTNTLIQYRWIDEIDWIELCQCASVTLVLASVVVRELDKLKAVSDKKRVRTRAASALRRLRPLFQEISNHPIRDSVDLEFRPFEPRIDFAAHRLNEQIADDWLLASFLEYKSESPEADVSLVSADASLALKAVARHIAHFQLPDHYLLQEEPDADQQRLREVEAELRLLRDRVPDLKLVFSNGTN